MWAAHWTVDSPGVKCKVDCWQYDVVGQSKLATVKTILPGASGDIDVNILYLDDEDETAPTPEPDEDWISEVHDLVGEARGALNDIMDLVLRNGGDM